VPKIISPPVVKGGSKGELPAYLSNGVIGLRVRDNPLAAGMTLVSGLTGRHPIRKIEAAALAPYPLALDIAIDDVWISDAIHALRIIDQAYDFQTAELTTRLEFKPKKAGVELEVVTFCSRSNPTLVCQQVSLRCDTASKVILRPMIDTRGVDGIALAAERGTPNEAEPSCDGWLLWETAGGLSRCGMALTTDAPKGAQSTFPAMQRGRFYSQHTFKTQKACNYRLSQIACLVPSAMHAQPDQQAVRLIALAKKKGFDALRSANRKEWQDLWRGRITLIGADKRWQALADAAFFYMMSSAHGSSPASTSIFGLATWGDYHYYFGHVMWDVETFIVPALAFFQPAAAQSLLDYRSDHLSEARKNALMRGRRGLQFPWESGPSTGEEAAPLPGTASWHEDHISLDVAHAFALFSAVTGREQFMHDKAWPVLCGVAEWISSRTTPTSAVHQILDSMGIAERQEPSDNPAFTIAASKVVLEEAIALAKRLNKPVGEDWQEIADNLKAPMRGKVLVSHDGYRAGEEKGATPDPLMAFFPLELALGEDVERETLAYFLKQAERYIGSPMLSALYGVWAARAGERSLSARLLDEGYAQFSTGRFEQILEYRPDKFPDQPEAGPFAANIGGFLISLLMGFPGLRPTLGDPQSWPHRPVVLPEGWEAITIEHLWIRGRPYRLKAVQGERTILEPHH
jgi:trehalose/maltose hydrolase-like predicted phosphorylase